MTAPLPMETAKRLLPWLVAVAFFMESLDTTILNTAVPTIADALGIAPLSMKAALTSYTLSLAVFIPISGWIADRYGTRLGLLHGDRRLHGRLARLRALGQHADARRRRILQGCGGALMMPVGRITMVRTFPKVRSSCAR
jgi:hypothetical protein